MIVVYIVIGCLWKITCLAMGASDAVQVHTFINQHYHSVNDVVANQSLVRSNRVVVVIDDVIQSTPEYQPRQICKDFVREYGMRLSYC